MKKKKCNLRIIVILLFLIYNTNYIFRLRLRELKNSFIKSNKYYFREIMHRNTCTELKKCNFNLTLNKLKDRYIVD